MTIKKIKVSSYSIAAVLGVKEQIKPTKCLSSTDKNSNLDMTSAEEVCGLHNDSSNILVLLQLSE